MNQPSTLGPNPTPVATSGSAITSAADLPRRQASASPLVQPASFANLTASTSAWALVGCSVVQPPLSLIARWNRPSPLGDATCMQTSYEPADSPKIVTLSGSPPNL